MRLDPQLTSSGNTPTRTSTGTSTTGHSFSLAVELAALNDERFSPGLPVADWSARLERRQLAERAEIEWLERERAAIAPLAAGAPRDAEAFVSWFAELERTGPGQGDPLHDWIAEHADRAQMRWFIAQEVAGEAGFEDLVALAQLKLAPRPKLEMARNYWDEMGRGAEKGMHGPMLAQVAAAFDLVPGEVPVLPEPIELGHVMTGLAHHRMYAYHIIGALGAIELTAPLRARKTYLGLKRLGFPAAATQYFLIHSTLDVKHSQAWNAEVLFPLVEESPDAAVALAEGALMRLRAGARTYAAYRARLGIELGAS